MAALARGEPRAGMAEELATRVNPGSPSTSGTASYHYPPLWTMTLSMPFAGLTDYMPRGPSAGESLKRPVEKLQAQRRQLIQDYRRCSARSRSARLRSDDALAHAYSPPSRGQVLLRAMVYENVLKTRSVTSDRCSACDGFFAHEGGRVPAHPLRGRGALIEPHDRLVKRLPAPAVRSTGRRDRESEREAGDAAVAGNSNPAALGPVPDVIDDPARIVMRWGIHE